MTRPKATAPTEAGAQPGVSLATTECGLASHAPDPMRLRALLTTCSLILALAAAPGAHAQQPGDTLRVASAFDPQTMDPHAVALL